MLACPVAIRVAKACAKEIEGYMDFVTAITAGTKALDLLKTLREIDKSFDAATWKAKVAELMSDVAEMKMALLDAREAIQGLEAEKTELMGRLRFRAEKTIVHKGWTYEILETGKPNELPLCQYCLTNGMHNRLHRTSANHFVCACPGCKTHYEARTLMYIPPRPDPPN